MKRLLVFVLVLIILFTPYIVSAQNKELDIPDTYEEVVKEYKDMAKIAQRYKELYEESDRNFQELQAKYEESEANLDRMESLYENQQLQTEKALESNEMLQDFLDTKNEIIDGLLNKKNISINTGVGVNLAEPEESLIMIGFEIGL